VKCGTPLRSTRIMTAPAVLEYAIHTISVQVKLTHSTQHLDVLGEMLLNITSNEASTHLQQQQICRPASSASRATSATIYERLLVLQEPIVYLTYPWVLSSPRALHPELLLVNKTIIREASSLFYAQNRFDFTVCESEQVASFFDHIGRNNASHIRNMCIDFPDIRNVDDDVNIEDDSARILAKIQSRLRQFEHDFNVPTEYK
jgi:hypothetical protein